VPRRADTLIDVIVIAGGGVVGLHVGIALAQLRRRRPILICERERSIGHHTSGRNSEVIHAGFAYPAGSLKAQACIEGNPRTYEWLSRLDVPHMRSGKWIVALSADDLPALEKVLEAGRAAGVPALRESDPAEVARAEPACRPFIGALHSGSSGAMDAAAYLRALERYFTAQEDCHFLPGCAVTGVDTDTRTVTTSRGQLEYDILVNSAGLWADEVYRMTRGPRAFRIRPFKGEYYSWRRGGVRSMVYPVPRRFLPGSAGDERQVSNMGIHVHRAVGGEVLVGPTQVELDWGQKADYRITTARDVFLRAAADYAEVETPEALSPAYAGNRPKLFEQDRPVGDFVLLREGAHIHLLGIESPGLTAAPALGSEVARLVDECVV
jgi:L-2-hydroxyglutarate oxidase LhgO